MKLTKRTTPQARDYQCDICKGIFCYKEMVNDEICGSCFDKDVNPTEREE